MSEYLKIKGLGRLILNGDKPQAGKEYLISIKAEAEGIYKDIKDPEEPEYTYHLRYLSTEQILEIGSKKVIKVENGKSWGQKLRWSLMSLGEKKGLDGQEYYESEVKKLIAKTLKEFEE